VGFSLLVSAVWVMQGCNRGQKIRLPIHKQLAIVMNFLLNIQLFYAILFIFLRKSSDLDLVLVL
jgi:hypothetical protein